MSLLSLVGVIQLTVGVLTGWGMVYISRTPREKLRSRVRDPRRWRQGHIELLMQGTIMLALGAAIPDPPLIPIILIVVFGWTAPLTFFPVAFRPELAKRKFYDWIDNIQFVGLSIGWVGLAVISIMEFVGR